MKPAAANARAGVDREVGQASEPHVPLGDVDRDEERVVVEQLGKARAGARSQVAVERHLRDVAGARAQEIAQGGGAGDRLALSPAAVPGAQGVRPAGNGWLHRRIILRRGAGGQR